MASVETRLPWKEPLVPPLNKLFHKDFELLLRCWLKLFKFSIDTTDMPNSFSLLNLALRWKLFLNDLVFLVADSIFVLANAQILDNPIVYASDGFCKFTGFSRSEVMKKNCDCSFLFGQLTDPETVREIHSALQAKCTIQKEVITYKSDGKLMKRNCESGRGCKSLLFCASLGNVVVRCSFLC